MTGLYDIFQGERKIGKAEITREGLYYRFRCCCDLTGEKIYRLTVTCNGKTENLGIPVPQGGEFWLTVRLPVSRFSKGVPEIRAVPKENQSWIPVALDMPFPYISELSGAVLEEKDGKMGVIISKQGKPDSDPNP